MKPTFKLTLFLFLLCSIAFLQNCKDTEFEPKKKPTPAPTRCDTCLPDITTKGLSTFGCRVNGKVWLPVMGYLTPESSANYYNGNLNIQGYNSNLGESLGFNIKVAEEGIKITFPNSNYQTSAGFNKIVNGQLLLELGTEPILSGKIELLRCDLDNGIYSGTFEFDVYDKYNKYDIDTIHITDGRFDLLE